MKENFWVLCEAAAVLALLVSSYGRMIYLALAALLG